jgi:hypothetical protein
LLYFPRALRYEFIHWKSIFRARVSSLNINEDYTGYMISSRRENKELFWQAIQIKPSQIINVANALHKSSLIETSLGLQRFGQFVIS